jgi:hypothetical protein
MQHSGNDDKCYPLPPLSSTARKMTAFFLRCMQNASYYYKHMLHILFYTNDSVWSLCVYVITWQTEKSQKSNWTVGHHHEELLQGEKNLPLYTIGQVTNSRLEIIMLIQITKKWKSQIELIPTYICVPQDEYTKSELIHMRKYFWTPSGITTNHTIFCRFLM